MTNTFPVFEAPRNAHLEPTTRPTAVLTYTGRNLASIALRAYASELAALAYRVASEYPQLSSMTSDDAARCMELAELLSPTDDNTIGVLEVQA